MEMPHEIARKPDCRQKDNAEKVNY